MPVSGFLKVPNIGAGHIEIKFEHHNQEKLAQARRIIEDMTTRGYILVVEHGGQYKPVQRFDARRNRYLLFEPGADLEAENQKLAAAQAQGERLGETVEPSRRKGRRGVQRGLPVEQTKAFGVAPTAGG